MVLSPNCVVVKINLTFVNIIWTSFNFGFTLNKLTCKSQFYKCQKNAKQKNLLLKIVSNIYWITKMSKNVKKCQTKYQRKSKNVQERTEMSKNWQLMQVLLSLMQWMKQNLNSNAILCSGTTYLLSTDTKKHRVNFNSQ